MARSQRIGGSFAPALDSSKVSTYRSIISSKAPEDLKEFLTGLCDMVDLFNQTPASTKTPRPHPMGKMTIKGLRDKETGEQLKPDVTINPRIIDLEEEEIKRIWNKVPWEREIAAVQADLDSRTLPSDLRNAAYHLIWYARELTLDREPLTHKLVKV